MSPISKIILFLLLGFTVSSSVFFGYKYFYASPKISPEQTENIKKILDKTNPRILKSTGQDSIHKYVSIIDEELENLDPESLEARTLLVRKANALALPRDVAFERSYYLETFSIFKKLIFSGDFIDAPKRSAIVALAKMYDQWCFGLNGIAPIIYQDKFMSGLYGSYKERYENKQIISMLVVSKFLGQYVDDEVLKKDNVFLLVKGKIEAVLLRSFYKDLKIEERNYLLTSLRDGIKMLEDAQYITFGTDQFGLSDKNLQYPIMLDIFESYAAPSRDKINNQKIDIEYEKSFSELIRYPGSDQITAAMFGAVLTVYYVDSIKRRYGNEKDDFINNTVLPRYYKFYEKDERIKPLMAAYFRDGLYGASTWETMKNNFLTLTQTNKKLKDFFVSIGFKEEDLTKVKNDWDRWDR